MLMSYIHALVRNANDAEDLFQEVGVVILGKSDVPLESRQFAAWCRGIARNLVLHYWRTKRRAKVLPSSRLLDALDVAYDEADASPDDEHFAGRWHLLAECLAQLPQRAREVLRMRYVLGYQSPQIGRRVKRSAEAVRQMLFRIRARLLECVEARMAGEGEHGR
jgi:RNA polymerase sigma-70 factor (ECF subfamily)